MLIQKREWPINYVYISIYWWWQKSDNQVEMWSCHQSVVWFGEGKRPLAWQWPSRTGSTCSTGRPNTDGLSAHVLHAVKASVVKPDASNTPHLAYKQLFIPKHVLHLSYHNTYNQRAALCCMLRPLSSYHSSGNNGMAEPCLESCHWKS